MTTYEAAVELIRQGDVCRLLHEVHRDNDNDHRALNKARRRYDSTRRQR